MKRAKKRLVVPAGILAAVAAACARPLSPAVGRLVDVPSAELPHVRWLAPAEFGEQARLDSWRAAVGPAIFREARAAQPPARLDDLLFVSWNVHVGTADVDRFLGDLQTGRLTGGRRPAQVVLMFQEAVRGSGVPPTIPAEASVAGWIGPAHGEAADVDAVARAHGFSIFYAPSMRNGGAGGAHPPSDRGNAILSSLPLAGPAAIELPGGGQRRVAITAALSLTGDDGPLTMSVGAAHLSTMGPPRTLWVFGAEGVRDAQARSLAAALPDGAMVLGADLNSWLEGADEPAARDLRRAFPGTPDGRRAATFGPGLVLDHMFFRAPAGWRARMVRAPEKYGSDHYALIGWFERERTSHAGTSHARTSHDRT